MSKIIYESRSSLFEGLGKHVVVFKYEDNTFIYD